MIEGACINALNESIAPENLKVVIAKPRSPEHGDFASGIALTLSSGNQQAATALAHNIVDNLKNIPKDVCVIRAEHPGFINFSLGPYWLCQALCELHKASESFAPMAVEGKIDSSVVASKENPAFYIPYMHAKLAAYLRVALEPDMSRQSNLLKPAIVDSEQWLDLLQSYKDHPLVFKPFFNNEESIFIEQKAVILHLDAWSEKLSIIANGQDKECITNYVYELAGKLDRLFEVCRLITDAEDVTKSYLGLIIAAKRVFGHALGLIGLAAPELI